MVLNFCFINEKKEKNNISKLKINRFFLRNDFRILHGQIVKAQFCINLLITMTSKAIISLG